MFGKRHVYTLANRSEQKEKPSPMSDSIWLVGVCFAFGVLGWYLISPLL